MGAAFATIPLQISTTYAAPTLSSRLPICISERAIKSMGTAVLTATPLITCLF